MSSILSVIDCVAPQKALTPMDVPAAATCGRNCLGSCCLIGATMPVFAFPGHGTPLPKSAPWSCGQRGSTHQLGYNRMSVEDLVTMTTSSSSLSLSDSDSASSESLEDNAEDLVMNSAGLLKSLLVSEWDRRADDGLFRYDVTACQSKVLAGTRGYIAQLNEGRHTKKRPTEFKIDQVMQAFDPAKFNFTKVGQNEVLLRFEASKDAKEGTFQEDAIVNTSPSVIAINVSPIEYGHILLIPNVLDRLPQRIDASSLLLALQMAAHADDPCFRVGYNSLGAFATINHLHFQAYFLGVPFPIERAPTAPITTSSPSSLLLSELVDYPVRVLAFSVTPPDVAEQETVEEKEEREREWADSLKDMADRLARVCEQLQETNVPFNLFIVDRGARAFLIPQCYAERLASDAVAPDLLECAVNPAVFEIAGHIVLKRAEDFTAVSEDWADRLLAAASLDDAEFQKVKELCIEAVQL